MQEPRHNRVLCGGLQLFSQVGQVLGQAPPSTVIETADVKPVPEPKAAFGRQVQRRQSAPVIA
eukprot:CAMPEP_0178434854 /NCGR_PEP_ID=MMETSP0689_2-20121128/33633_1 /TAXON_ID=160604 /ORGANISM="Amphidinium massartii, Strain CS-259" /LENGTH=62 /DNA_ID=CAMNT_0020056921 /DNA_START=594 /DNA_END=782 /DNA_ORIENTATION=+